MKGSEIRQMTTVDLLGRISQDEDNLSKMRFQVATSQLTNTAQIRLLKKDLARMKTVLNERKRTGEA
ncbi:MAG: 50S ribosomal protein L29 [Ignavibacteria bacterium]|jgi:large subunit ribosomal protein L29|nr:50S ribosomal protein L29 [Ignavibacteria bacterium]